MDYRSVAASLRRKAADSAVTPQEAASLLAKATELEAKYGKATPPTDPPKRTYAPQYRGTPDPLYWLAFGVARRYEQDIVEEGYRWQPEDY